MDSQGIFQICVTEFKGSVALSPWSRSQSDLGINSLWNALYVPEPGQGGGAASQVRFGINLRFLERSQAHSFGTIPSGHSHVAQPRPGWGNSFPGEIWGRCWDRGCGCSPQGSVTGGDSPHISITSDKAQTLKDPEHFYKTTFCKVR